MPKKRKINPAKLEEIKELHLASLVAREAAATARHTDREAEDAFNRKLNDLRLKVATGSYTTDHHLLDINIVVNCSVAKDGHYDAMVELEKVLALHETELTADARSSAGSTPRIENLGILPRSPRLQFSVGGAFGRGRVLGGDASTRTVLPVVDRNGTVLDLLVPKWERTGNKDFLGANIVFEDKLQWILDNEPNMHLAVALWSKAHALGRPLSPPERVTREIMTRRESCAIELNCLASKLESAIQELRKALRCPDTWGRHFTVIDGSQVVVSFPRITGNIKQARRELSRKAREAVTLTMNEEPISPPYGNVLELLESSAEWAD